MPGNLTMLLSTISLEQALADLCAVAHAARLTLECRNVPGTPSSSPE